MDDVITVVGKQLIDFVNKETGEKIKGINLFVVRPDENVQGLKAVKVFINPESKRSSQPLDCKKEPYSRISETNFSLKSSNT